MMYGLFSLRGLRITATSVPVAASMVMASAGTYAQESVSGGGPGRAVSIVPRVSITETLTDNVRLSSANRQSDLITEVSPGIHISRESRRLKGFFDYSLSGINYAKNSSSSQIQHALNTAGTLEAVDNWAYLDFSGSISQQAISAFGTQPSGNTSSINSNQTEVSSYRLSPYVRGRLGDLANYEARYGRSGTSSGSAFGSGVTSTDGLVNINGDTSFRRLGWSANATRQSTDYNLGRSTEADRFIVGLSYTVTPQLIVSAKGGREANNYTSLDKQSYANSGVGFNWNFEHRTARTAWRFSDTKDVSATPNQAVVGSLGSIFDLYYNQFASIESDPVRRTQLVNAYLLANGINPNAVVVSSFLTSALSLQRRQDLSFALLGVRDTITFIATRSESTRLDTVSTAVDDFSTSALVRQRGFSVNYTHRLTPDYSMGVLVSQQRTSGVSSLQDATLRFLNVSLTGKVGNRATASVGVRRVVSSGNSPYVENAITGTLSVLF
jgi:uncharacterized protein (PEP-CTERM system associated)